jgi:hypothetical protein
MSGLTVPRRQDAVVRVMEANPSSIARQVGGRIAAAGVRVMCVEGWGTLAGRPAEGWQADSARIKIALPTGSAEVAAAVAARLDAAGAAGAKVELGIYNQGIHLTFTVTDETAEAVAEFDAVGLTTPTRSGSCAVCDGPLPVGGKGRTCSRVCRGVSASRTAAANGRQVGRRRKAS